MYCDLQQFSDRSWGHYVMVRFHDETVLQPNDTAVRSYFTVTAMSDLRFLQRWL
jgi:hypothetical protein